MHASPSADSQAQNALVRPILQIPAARRSRKISSREFCFCTHSSFRKPKRTSVKSEAADLELQHCCSGTRALAETERRGANAPNKVLEDGWKELRGSLAVRRVQSGSSMYLDAVKAMYEGYQTTSGAVRWNRYLATMDSIRRRYPHDINASLFYALGLVWTAGPGEQGSAQRRKALAILLPIFQEHPNNPGAAHYIIHAADTPELAHSGTTRRTGIRGYCSDLRAQHMPSHIFNRLGYLERFDQRKSGVSTCRARVDEEQARWPV